MATIVLIDDEHDPLLVTRKMLEYGGHTVRAYGGVVDALDGEGGFESVDLVVSDIWMPVPVGELFVALDAIGVEIPTVLITADSNERMGEGAAAHRMVIDIIYKPIGLDELLDRIAEVLK